MGKTEVKTKTATKPKAKPKAAISKAPEKQGKPALNTKKNQEKLTELGIDFCGVKLSALRRAFIVNYVTPGQPCYHNALQSALKAGYKRATATADIYEIIREPDIQKIIKTNEALSYQALRHSAMRALEIKQRRAFFDPIDYFEEKEITVRSRNLEFKKKILELKDLNNMTPEQRECIDGFDIKGPGADPVYILPNREKELNDIIKIDSELSKSVADTGEEETREIIMERITIRETRRTQRSADIEYEVVDRPDFKEDA